MAVPKRVADRLSAGLKRYQEVLAAQRARDVSEADTVTIVKDILSDLFGFDKYAELTSEHSIRGTYCDLAIHCDGRLQLLIEVKAIGLDLKDTHIKQAIDYAANQGLEWVVLTNGIEWILFHVVFAKPINKHEVIRLDLTTMNARTEDDRERLYLFTKEGLARNALSEFRDRKDATSRFVLAAILLNSDAVQAVIRREVRRISGLTVDQKVIDRTMREQVLKRDAIEGEQAESARRRVARSSDRRLRRSDGDDDDKAAKPAETKTIVVVP